jgi:hypothetical protein
MHIHQVRVEGLDPQELYAVCLHFQCEDEDGGAWKWNPGENRWTKKNKRAGVYKPSTIGERVRR